MGTGYTRNDTANNIADGNIINASDLDGEFDAVQSAFNASTGHTHDGTAGEGAPIETIGPSQDVVATASVLRPKTDNTVDLGTTSLEYKDLFLDGTAHIDTLDVDENASITGTLGVTGTTTLGTANITTGTITTADINGGNIDGTIIGASSAAAITGTTITGTSFVTSGDMTFGDNNKAIFGAGSDLSIYHDGSQSFVQENGTGQLVLDTQNGARVKLTSNNGTENMVVANKDGDVELYYDNAQKLATTSTGISVTGNATFADDGKAIFGAGSDLQIYHDGSHSYIHDNGTGDLIVRAENFRLTDAGNTEFMMQAVPNGAVTLYHNGSSKLATTSTGVDITGTLTSDGLEIDGKVLINAPADTLAQEIRGRSSDDVGYLQFSNNAGTTSSYIGSNGSYLNFEVGSAERMRIANNGDISFYEDTGTTAKFFWDASAESLGIGTTSPAATLHSYMPSGNTENRIETGAGASYLRLKANTQANAAYNGIYSDYGSTNDWFISGGQSSSNEIKFGIANSTKMTIDSSGNVGIGTSSPAQELDVNGQVRGVDRYYFKRASDNYSLSALARWDGSTGSPLTGTAGIHTVVGSEEASSSVIFAPSNTERMRIDSSGNVGIGVSSIQASAVGKTLETSGCLISGGTLNSHQTNRAVIEYNVGANSMNIRAYGATAGSGIMTFATGGGGGSADSEAMRIDSSGNLLVGKTTSSFATAGTTILPSGNVTFTRSNAGVVDVNRLSSDGSLINLYKDGTTVGSIGTLSGNVTIGTGDTGVQFNQDTNAVMPHNISTGANVDASIDLGYSSGGTNRRFKDLYLSGTAYVSGSGVVGRFGNTTANNYVEVIRTTTAPSYINIGATSGSASIEGGPALKFQITDASGSGSSEAMRIDSSGNLLVGMTSANTNNDGGAIREDGLIHGKRAGVVGAFNRKSSDGDIIQLSKDNTAVGVIGTKAGNIYLGDGARTLIVDGVVVKGGYSDGSDADNAQDLGESGTRWKDLYLSGGVYLGGTGAANKLDDYETGTWTPYFNSSGATFTYNTQYGAYVKVGNIVHAQFYLNATATGTTSNSAEVQGLPFTSANLSPYHQWGCSCWFSGSLVLQPLTGNNSTAISLWKNGAVSTAIASDIAGGRYLVGHVTYQTT